MLPKSTGLSKLRANPNTNDPPSAGHRHQHSRGRSAQAEGVQRTGELGDRHLNNVGDPALAAWIHCRGRIAISIPVRNSRVSECRNRTRRRAVRRPDWESAASTTRVIDTIDVIARDTRGRAGGPVEVHCVNRRWRARARQAGQAGRVRRIAGERSCRRCSP